MQGISAFADDITDFIPPFGHRGYEEGGCKVRARGKSQGQLWQVRRSADRSWRDGVPLPGPFHWSDGPFLIHGVWFGPDLELERKLSELSGESLARWKISFPGSNLDERYGVGTEDETAFPRLKSNPNAESCIRSRGKDPFFAECHKAIRNLSWFSDLSLSRKELYRGLEGGGHRFGSARWDLLSKNRFLNNSEFLLTWRFAQNALPLADWAFKVGLADMPDCARRGSGLEETALHDFYNCERVRPFWSQVREWMTRIDSKQLVLLDVGYVVDNVDPLGKGEKRVAFLVILAVALMVIWETRK